MFRAVNSRFLRSTAAIAIMAAGLVLTGCSEMYSRTDFATRVKDKSDSEVAKLIGKPDHNLFHQRTNLRFGCTILRHYLDIENGDLFRALGRYNGSLGRPEYPDMVRANWEKHWAWKPRQLAVR